MADKRDYYEVLGLSKDASEADIKSSFRKLSRQYHPDMQAGKSDAEKKNAEEKFKEVAEAYEVLSNKDKRANYDQFGFSSGNSAGMDMSDFMSRHASMFEDFFGGTGFGFNFGFNRANNPPNPNRPENGRNVQIKISIDFKEMVHGTTKELDINLSEPCDVCGGYGTEKGTQAEKCSHCNGTGMLTQRNGFMVMQTTCHFCGGKGYTMKNCPHCHGSRRVSAKKHLKLKIPAGIESSQRLRVQNGGECGVCGGANGNLYVIVEVNQSEIFERIGNDIKVVFPIPFTIATLGGKLDVPTPYGYCNVNVPAGTTSGNVIKVYGKGIKANSSTGNLLVEVVVEPLSNLSDKQKELIDELSKTVTIDNLKQSKELKDKCNKFYN